LGQESAELPGADIGPIGSRGCRAAADGATTQGMRRALGELAQTSGVAAGLEMKPFPPILLTKEDHDIWCRVTWDGHLHGWHELAQDSDRRDAELMLRAQTPQFREFPWLWGSDKMWNIDVRGPVQWYNLFDET
jgi:hypothetical protein